MAGVNLTTVPYKGAAPAITDLIGGQIQVMFTTVASCASLVEAGQLRAIAVTSAERSAAFPQLPTVAEAGVPGYAGGILVRPVTRPRTRRPISSTGSTNPRRKSVQSEAFKKLSVNEGLVMVAAPPAQSSTATSPARRRAGAR